MTVRKRVVILFLGLAAASMLLALRLAYLQIIRTEWFTDRALDQRMRPFPLEARRGTIYDRNGNKLAVSISADAVYARPVQVTDPAGAARALAPLVEMPAEEIEARLRQKVETVWLSRRLEPETARQIRNLRLPGVEIVERPQRYYPNHTLASHVLGFVGIDNQGLEGLELQYDQVLRGTPGRLEAERDAVGREIPGGLSRYVPPRDGNELVLTIDQVIQYRAERVLEEMVRQTQSELGIFVAIEPSTGEVLAMANWPAYDPNEYQRYPAEQRKNRAVTDQFEPGSTFKIVTAAAGLNEGVVRPEDRFYDPGSIEIGGGRVSCWSGGHGSQSFVEATENSCNPVFALVGAQRLGPERFFRGITAFGFGRRLGLDFPGEAGGNVPRPGSIQHGELLRWANIGFGQGVGVTALQLAVATAAIANGGVLMQPRLVREIRDPEGRVVKRFEPVPIRQAISREVAGELSEILRSVVVNGSGQRAEIPGYRPAGKTGTAQIPEPGGGYGNRAMASFVGFAPYDSPRIAAVAMLYNVGVQPRWGGLWAAPTWKAIVEDALEHLRVPRRQEKPAPPQQGPDGQPLVQVPNVRNLLVGEALQLLTAAQLQVMKDGEGEIVRDQTPKPGAAVPPGTTVVLYFGEPELYNEASEVTVPDVRGLSIRDAAIRLSEVGLHLRLTGSGVATSQFPEAGTKVPWGTPVQVNFEPPPNPAPGDRT